MTLTHEEKVQRKNALEYFNEIDGIKFNLHRFQPPNDWDPKWYGVPEVKTVRRSFAIHPKGKEALRKSVGVMNSLHWGQHIGCILTGGANVERNQRGTDKPSPHSIWKGSWDDHIFATAIDIGGIVWQHKVGCPFTSYVADRSAIPRMVAIDAFDYGNKSIPKNSGSEFLNIVPSFNKPYVVLACIFSQFFGTVLHDKCSGYTGVLHRDHFHLDCTRPVAYRSSNSQDTLIQMALNLGGSDLELDGHLGLNSKAAWKLWANAREIPTTDIDELFLKLMEITPIEHGQIQ